MKNGNIYRSIFSIILTLGLLSVFIYSQSNTITEGFASNWNSEPESKTHPVHDLIADEEKQRGAHVFGHLDSTNLQPFIKNNFNWITMVSYSSQKDFTSPNLAFYRGGSLEMKRRDSAWKSQIDIAHSLGFKVSIKPHVWIHSPSEGKWRSDIFPTNDENWALWKKNYREFILLYAQIAQENNVELFCIGTELSRLTVEKPEYWVSLIQEVRSIYSGKITYAANWYNEFEKITFWDELDYIGIQAYFPLVKNENPSVKQISKGWKKYFSTIESVHKKYNRNILFTEMGYKSTADAAINPWEWIEHSESQNKVFSTQAQANCYQAFFNTVWKKEWFAGVHIWQMRSNFVDRGGRNDLDFNPQGKPAEKIISKGFE